MVDSIKNCTEVQQSVCTENKPAATPQDSLKDKATSIFEQAKEKANNVMDKTKRVVEDKPAKKYSWFEQVGNILKRTFMQLSVNTPIGPAGIQPCTREQAKGVLDAMPKPLPPDECQTLEETLKEKYEKFCNALSTIKNGTFLGAAAGILCGLVFAACTAKQGHIFKALFSIPKNCVQGTIFGGLTGVSLASVYLSKK